MYAYSLPCLLFKHHASEDLLNRAERKRIYMSAREGVWKSECKKKREKWYGGEKTEADGAHERDVLRSSIIWDEGSDRGRRMW